MAKQPKGVRYGGRQKGTSNKFTAEVKDMVRGALDALGGQEYLVTQGTANPSAFMSLVGKVLPLTLAGDKQNPVQVNMTASDQDIITRYNQEKK